MICSTCGKNKSDSDFYKGRHSCKTCESELQSSIRRKRIQSGNFKIVKQKICIYCHETKPIDEFRKDNTKTDGYGSYCKKCLRERRRKFNIENNIMEDYTFDDFDKSCTRSKLQENEISINYKKSNHTVTFNQDVSAEIVIGGLTHVRIRKDNITGDIHFVFNNTTGCAATIRNTKGAKNIIIINKDLVDFLVKELNLDKNVSRSVIEISGNLANRSSEYLTYKIIGVE